MLRLCLKNTFLEVVKDEEFVGHHLGEATKAAAVHASPASRRARSAEATPSPMKVAPSGASGAAASPQLRRLSFFLAHEQWPAESAGPAAVKEEVEDALSSCASCGSSVGSIGCTDSSALGCPVAPVGHKSPPADTCSTADTEQSTECARQYCHKSVPRLVDFESTSRSRSSASAPDETTTLMVRNVPNRFTQDDLLSRLEALGFSGAINFLYMPRDKSSKASVGYAFVNFISSDWCARFTAEAQGLDLGGGSRQLVVSPAHLQGLTANLEHYERSAAKSKKIALYRPLVM